jgi:hypothetical protein
MTTEAIHAAPYASPFAPERRRAPLEQRIVARELPPPFVPASDAERRWDESIGSHDGVRQETVSTSGRRRRIGRRRASIVERGVEAWGSGPLVVVGESTLAPHTRQRMESPAPPIHAHPSAGGNASPTPDLSRPTSAANRALLANAADRLERVARRVRSGELHVLGLTEGMTDAGALAATLAALLTPAS